jgi:hypothetical protein
VLSFAGKFFVQAYEGTLVADAIATAVGVVIILAVALGLKAGIFRGIRNLVLRGTASPGAPAPHS